MTNPRRSTPPRRLRVGRRMAAVAAIGVAASAAMPASAHAASGFTPGQLVVYRVGDGTTSLTSAATPVFLDQYPTTGGAASFTLPLPSATTGTTNAVTASGTATSEGALTLSSDGNTLLVPGYNTPAGTASVAGTTSSASANQREVAEVNGAGSIDTSTAFSSLYSKNNIRGAASPNGGTIYAAGPTNGVVATTKGSTTGTQLTSASNYRVVNLFGGQLYASSATTGNDGISAIPTATSGAPYTTTPLPGLDSSSSASPYGFALFDETGGSGPDTAYVADSTAGAILKYVLQGTTWVADGSASSGATTGVTGLTAVETGGVVSVYAVSPTSLVALTDAGQGALTSASLTTLASAPTNEAFRGVAFAPSSGPAPATPEVPTVIVLPLAALTLTGGFLILRGRRPRTA